MINFCIFDSHAKKTYWNILWKEIQCIKNVLSGIYFLFPTTNYTKLKVLLYEREIYFNYIMINLTILCVHKIGIYIFHYNFPRKYLQKIIRSRQIKISSRLNFQDLAQQEMSGWGHGMMTGSERQKEPLNFPWLRLSSYAQLLCCDS